MTHAARSAGAPPRVAVLGGGRGLTATIRAARAYAGHVTAVVATADDSGSTGRLRAGMGIAALGDLRRCLAALADAEETPLGRAFEFRFTKTDLEGHALGNLLLASLASVTGGGLLEAIGEASRLLGMDERSAQALPATVDPVDLCATTVNGGRVFGQYAISKTPGIARITLRPGDARAPDSAVKAILGADQVILGPGSLYTSVLAAAMIPGIKAALAETAAPLVYVCNLEPEDAETLGYDTAAHIAALLSHGIRPDIALAGPDSDPAGQPGKAPVPVVTAPVAAPDGITHDARKLAAALAGLLPSGNSHYSLPVRSNAVGFLHHRLRFPRHGAPAGADPSPRRPVAHPADAPRVRSGPGRRPGLQRSGQQAAPPA